MPARVQRPHDHPPFHSWKMNSGAVWTTFHRIVGGYLLRFPELADFEVSTDGTTASCWPTPELPASTRDHLFYNQVLPLMLGERGQLVFHGSCVECGEGAIAFLGQSGKGKSTLATMFALSGMPFLTDDALVLELVGSHYIALPSRPSIRLWDDSREALLGSNVEFSCTLSYTDKGRVLSNAELPFCSESRPLIAAYFLGEGTAGEIAFRLMGGAETLASWVRHSFLLDIEHRPMLRSHFEKVVSLAQTIPSIELDYPRRYEDADDIRRAIVDHALRRGTSA